MIADAKFAVRNVWLILAQRGLHVVAGVLFAVLIPRLMGPETFGRFALVTSVSLWFALFSGMNSAQIMGRFVPELALQEDGENLQKFFGNLLVVRIANGVASAGLYFLLTALWFQELDTVVLALIAGSVLVRTVAKLTFALFLGLNLAARWALGDTLRRWLSLALLIPGFYYGGLRGACLSLLVTEIVVLAIGLRWAGPHFSWSQLRLDTHYLAPYLKFSLYFFAGNMLLTASQRSGEMLVRVITGDYVEVGYFGVAYRGYLLVYQSMWQLAMAFAPLFTILLIRGKVEELKQWSERLLKWTAVAGVLAVYGALLLGNDLVPLALGAAYGPVAANLPPLMAALVMMGLGSVARLLSLTYDRAGVAVTASLVQLLSFWAIGAILVISRGSLAASLAVLASSMLYAVYFTWRMRRVVRYPLRNWMLTVALGGLFFPLVLFRSTLVVNGSLYVAFVASYAGLLLLLRVVTPGEFAAMRRALRSQVSTGSGVSVSSKL